MAAQLFSKGALLGLALAAPLGPIGALCINRSLSRGFVAGVAGGLGTAVADALYAGFAAFGFVAFAATLALVAKPVAIIGGLFLPWLGFKFLRSDVPADDQQSNHHPHRHRFVCGARPRWSARPEQRGRARCRGLRGLDGVVDYPECRRNSREAQTAEVLRHLGQSGLGRDDRRLRPRSNLVDHDRLAGRAPPAI
jgi:hypothetical protein